MNFDNTYKQYTIYSYVRCVCMLLVVVWIHRPWISFTVSDRSSKPSECEMCTFNIRVCFVAIFDFNIKSQSQCRTWSAKRWRYTHLPWTHFSYPFALVYIIIICNTKIYSHFIIDDLIKLPLFFLIIHVHFI